MTFWILLLAGGMAWLLWYMVAVPGKSYSVPLKPLTAGEIGLRENLRRHVAAIASHEHHANERRQLEAAAQYIESELAKAGYRVGAQRIEMATGEVRNLEAEAPGASRADEIIVVGAHYDSVAGAPGGNDNGSGVAAALELARLFRRVPTERTLRFVLFVNEEPPFYRTPAMGSRAYAARARARKENIVAMFSLETIGYYSDREGSQRYPFPLRLFYPNVGNFIAFVSNLRSRALLHEVIAAFRRHAEFPSEGTAAPAILPGVDWSDHWSFWRERYPAVMVTDTAPFRYPYYHTAQDTPDKVDYDRLARVVTGLEGMLRDVAGAR